MRHQCGRLKLKYALILAAIGLVTCFLLTLHWRNVPVTENGGLFVPSDERVRDTNTRKEDPSDVEESPNKRMDKLRGKENIGEDSPFAKEPVLEDVETIRNERTIARKDVLGKKRVNIYVVEEHHEVLPYWYEAANNGIIPKSGNTLIHFDGHSDMAPPEFVAGYPFFKWPKPSQLKYLIQTNDVFIQTAAMAGLIDRLIWVWPDWDRENHEQDYVKVLVRLGWYQPPNNTDEVHFCMCATLNATYMCRSMIDFGMGVDDNGFQMPTIECKIKKTLTFEEVSESYAMTFFRSRYKAGNGDHVMLDIDEDYFGCTYAVMPLFNVNVTFGKVKYINKRVSSLFCPKTTEQDHETDRLLHNVLRLYRQQKRCESSTESKQTLPCNDFTDNYINKFTVSDIVKKNSTSLINICPLKLTSISVVLKGIFQKLRRMSDAQLKALQEVGFCSATSPKSYINDEGFAICMGANTPQNTAVLVHSPTRGENANRSQSLGEILQNIPNFSPKVVTVARSVRDGYTPREYFESIESDILSMLKRRFGGKTAVQYDKGLLGGIKGWPARRRELSAAMQNH